MEQVVKNDYKSVSIPAISTGVFKFPITKFAVNWAKTNRLLEVVPKVLEYKEETVKKDPNIDTGKSDKK